MSRRSTPVRLAGAVTLVVAALGCGDGSTSPRAGEDLRTLLHLPPHLSLPAVPDYYPVTAEKIELGRRLFYDLRLSGNGSQSCASCHQQRLGFSDGFTVPRGSTGQALLRNSQGLANAAYFSSLT